jgi:hypothetical protein
VAQNLSVQLLPKLVKVALGMVPQLQPTSSRGLTGIAGYAAF